MRAFGATVVEQGKDFDEAREWVEHEAAGSGASLRAFRERAAVDRRRRHRTRSRSSRTFADPDVILVPIGGGSGACGCCIVRTGLGRKTRVIGVQAAEADAFTRSWRGPERVSTDSTGTFAEGLATRYSFDLTFEHSQTRARRHRHADRSGARRGRAPGAARHAQPRRGRRRRIARCRDEAARSASRARRSCASCRAATSTPRC